MSSSSSSFFTLSRTLYQRDLFGATVPSLEQTPTTSIELTTPIPRRQLEYLAAGALSQEERGFILIQLFRAPELLQLDSEGCESWLWTIIDFAVPSLAATVLSRSRFNDPQPRVLNDAQLDYIMTGGSDADKLRHFHENNADDVEVPDVLPAIPPIPIPLFPGFSFSEDQNRKADWQCCASIVGIVLFAIGKAPNELNLSAFGEKRRLAVERKLGKTGDDIPTEADVPNLSTLQFVNSYFALKSDLRELLVLYFVERLYTPAAEPVEIINTHLRLWFGVGLTHVALIVDLIAGYGGILEKMPAITGELMKFQNEYQHLLNSTEPHKPYLKVMKGDKFNILNARKFPELIRIARTIAVRKDDKFKNFAPNLGEAKCWNQFVQLVKSNHLLLPGEVGSTSTAVPATSEAQ